ncbi:MAG: hypothetical protein M3463_17570, partial [Verrucomicrobiota bacterium]|nr:hypothetical protein [Verrucomicrobiota bacterium]
PGEAAGELPQSERAEDHEVEIAAGLFFTARERAKDEREIDAGPLFERPAQRFGKAAGLKDEIPDVGIERVMPVRRVLAAIAVGHHAKAGEALKFLADGADGEAD